ncbi:PSD1 and planctomycete cytochrome C domain-containing protein [Spongiimicrobium salis]|uniref:PSD1 and planctomycete cytochrome C domain-containing protein n=1 Tax=Spongiimicrobium salis TaxID=1667022 RepID=UPI00374CFED0
MMKVSFVLRSISYAFFIGILVMGCSEGNPKTTLITKNGENRQVPEHIDFTFHVKPILSDRCFKCHGPDKNAIEGGLSLHTAEGAYMILGEKKDHHAIVPGDIEKSSLVERIYTADEGVLMPPPESNLILSDYEKAILKRWVEQGAEYKEHWAFVAPTAPKIPTELDTVWGNNEIDKFTLKKMEEQGLRPSSDASKEKLIRRIYFDLTGLPPSLSEIEAFVRDKAPNAYEKVLDHILNTTDYAEHMASEWMDISRYADTHGYQDDFERTMWPWRDWVIHAFKKNMPYDEFITYQLAGDLLPNPTREQLLATGFNRNHKITAEGGVIPEEYRIEYVEDRTITFGTAFLGLTLECARCHDHKYDPISQQDHFELFSFFNTINEKGLMGSPTEIPEPYMMITKKETEGVLNFVQLQDSVMTEVPVMIMKEMDTPRSTHILDRGVYDQAREEVFPNTPKAILPFPTAYPRNRLGLAQWLFHKDNPLTARVTVNRLWQRMFGNGLVASSFDFGNQGALPTHPELLDFLALKLQKENWDTKRMLKYIALSKTYQQDTKITEEALQMDPENRFLARAPRLRLSAELIRDQALKISGLLYKKVGGPSVKPYQPEGIWEETTGGGGGSTAAYVQSTGQDLYRKSLYTFWKRTVPPPSMMTFDASSRDLCSVKRQETNTPLQALVLLNDPQLIEASRVMAAQALRKYSSNIDQQIAELFSKATSRKPRSEEMEVLKKQYASMLEKIDRKEIIPSEYLTIGKSSVADDIPERELTALALTAHTVLNLDETISRG